MRFDDALTTVMSAPLASPASVQAAWRQLVDLAGRGRVSSVEAAVAALADLQAEVPLAVRAASARALIGAQPPLALVRLLARDDMTVAAPVLRTATLAHAEWVTLLPELGPAARAILRHRRDLPEGMAHALDSYGTVDFVIEGAPGTAAIATPISLPEAATPSPAPATIPGDPGAFVSLGRIAMGLPVVAEALRRENDNESPLAAADHPFRIADIVARIEAYQKQEPRAAPPPPAPAPAFGAEGFRFETDAAGIVRWVEGAPRGAIVGVSLAQAARPGAPGVDGIAAGACRRRARFDAARLQVGAGSPAAGLWLISAVPGFDPASGRFTGYRGSARRPRADELPRASQAAAADAVRQIVHELRTPTNAISGFSEMIEHQLLGPVADPYREQAATIRGESRRLLAAIDDIDTAARIEAGSLPTRKDRVALDALVAESVRDLAALAADRGAGITVSGTAAQVVADRDALARLVARLLAAMLGAAAAGEAIAIDIAPATADRVALAVDRPAALDAYPGETILDIAAEDCATSLLGTGFALRLARNLAREIGGALTIGQRRLTLTLPRAVEQGMEQAQHL
ncbi:sensor histidine kinase [Sphingomonas donggukensis]|uniref:histidine kinase n=1 Tax=Sphingomonas donggukensis TaxID=2949093 RepID=A0ABY4TWL1_9SPHN|nr:histidine kinase dimerization/phospho-acceptor domain-containing protein [Sphingomonas donggukensis]URW76799.1 sensor histidine kinase [Sphingomonas donggukensis]